MEDLKKDVGKMLADVAEQMKLHHRRVDLLVAKAIRDALTMPVEQSHRMLLGIAEMMEEE